MVDEISVNDLDTYCCLGWITSARSGIEARPSTVPTDESCHEQVLDFRSKCNKSYSEWGAIHCWDSSSISKVGFDQGKVDEVKVSPIGGNPGQMDFVSWGINQQTNNSSGGR